MSQPKQGNYFKLPNEIFNMDLSAGEIALYAFLMRMEDRETYTCYPSYKTIGKALQMSNEQEYGDEICQAVGRKRAYRNRAHSRRKP